MISASGKKNLFAQQARISVRILRSMRRGNYVLAFRADPGRKVNLAHYVAAVK